MLGDIVHNEDVLSDMAALGIRRITDPAEARNATLIICAHGVPKSTLTTAREHGCRIVDATCPMVREIHRVAAELEEAGRSVIVIGDQDHDEVRGIVGQLSHEAIVVSDPDDLPVAALERIDKGAVVVQSTQDIARVESILAEIAKHVADIEFHNTICSPTTRKQREIVEMAAENDVMIVLGSRTSANTRRLHELSSAVNERTHWIRTVDEIDDEWFKGAGAIGVSAGASTPDSVTAAVVEYLEVLADESGD
jgi:4-hydroxy-3-methylbut-2-enyl diphosphate reductase